MAMTRYNNYDRSFIRPFEMLDEIFSALPIDTLANVSVNAGAFKIAYRIFPKNDRLPHRQDFCYVKWFL